MVESQHTINSDLDRQCLVSIHRIGVNRFEFPCLQSDTHSILTVLIVPLIYIMPAEASLLFDECLGVHKSDSFGGFCCFTVFIVNKFVCLWVDGEEAL